jgi:hypothetical protein
LINKEIGKRMRGIRGKEQAVRGERVGHRENGERSMVNGKAKSIRA